MADMKDDPAMLYDEEFMRKREEMFKDFSSDNEISSGRDKDDLFDEEEEVTEKSSKEEKEKKGGLFSRLRKRKDIEADAGYDIFDLGEIEDKKPKAEKVQNKEQEPKKKKDKKKENRKKAEDYISVSDIEKENEKEIEKEPIVSLEEKGEELLKAAFSEEETAKEKEDEAEALAKENEVFEEKAPLIENKTENEADGLEEKVEASSKDEAEDFSEKLSNESAVNSMDDINALLESVGIKPVGEDETDEEQSETKKIDTKVLDNSFSDTKAQEETKTFEAFNDEKTKKVDAVRADNNTLPSKDDGQIILEGYKDEEAPKTEDEEKAKERLKNTRKNLIDNFRVLKNDAEDSTLLEKEQEGISQSITEDIKIADGEGIFEAVEKIGKNKNMFKKLGEKSAVNKLQQKAKKQRQKEQFISASALSKALKKERTKIQGKLKITVILTAILSVLTVMGSAYTDGGALSKIMGEGGRIYVLIEAVVFAFCLFICKDKLKDSFDSVVSLRIDSTFPVLITCAFVFLHLIISLVSGIYPETSMTLYTPFAAFSLLVSLYSDYLSATDKGKSVSLMMRNQELTGVCPVTNKADAAALAHGISESGEPIIYYSRDVSFPENLDKERDEKSSDGKYYTVIAMVIGAVGVVLSLVLSIINKSAWIFGTFFASFVCLLMPNMRGLVLSLLMSKTNSSLMYSGATITTLDAPDEIGKANAVIAESSDLFVSGVSKFKLVPKSRMALSDAVVYAASTLKNTNCLIKDSFDDFLKESEIVMPEAEDVTYEDRLGYSSWVAGRRVLVGNRQMLVQHSIDCPTEEEEYNYAKGRSVMYVVVEGIIAATFIVSFSVKKEVAKHISDFNKTGLILMLSSSDPWINEDNAAMKLRIDKATIKIASSKGTEIISSYKNASLKAAQSTMICSKKQKNIISLVNAAHNLYSAQKLSLLIYTVGIILSFILLTVFSFLKISVGFSSFVCIALQLVWAAASYYIGAARIK